jgi:DNA helicase-2/ATP-dependent DNA helicase PcrA
LIRYLSHEQSQSNEHAGIIDISAHENALSLVAAPYQKDEWAILKKLVENYFMPVTHLANFLNIVDGGPLFFIEQNLLRFPQPMNVSGVFGSAIHKAIAELIMYPKYHAGETPSEDHILATFSQELARGRLPHTEFTKQRKRGIDVLKKYVDARNSYFVMDDQVELDMKNQGVTLHQAVLTGKIDFLRIKEGKFHVVDFKTGRTFTSWEATGMTDTDKIKLHKFKQQLIYYKILLEHSVEYTQPIASLAIEFVESVAEHNSPVILEYSPSDDEVARTEKLIATVYKKITALEFPDISEYEKNYKGILAFEQALIDEG